MKHEYSSYAQVAIAAEVLQSQGKEVSAADVSKILKLSPAANCEVETYLEQWNDERKNNVKSHHVSSQDDIAHAANDEDDIYEMIAKRTEELKQSLALVKATLESTEDGILIIDSNGKMVDWNNKFLEIYSITLEMMEDRDESVSFNYVISQLKNPEELVEQITGLYNNPDASGNMGDCYFHDGRILERFTQPHRVNNEIVGRVWSFRDVTAKRVAEERLRLYKRAISASNHGVVLIDANEGCPVIYANDAFLRISGYDENEIIDRSIEQIFETKRDKATLMRLKLSMKESKDTQVEILCRKKSGEEYWAEVNLATVRDKDHEVSHYVALVNDITLRKRMEEQLVEQATHDILTNLPNRALLIDRIQCAIEESKRQAKKMAVLFLDLDEFKLINDSLGHGFGDKLLCEVAKRLVNNVDKEITVGRIGGDEFILLIPHYNDENEVMTLANHLLGLLSQPYSLDGKSLMISSSIGIALYPKDDICVEGLMKCADMSMYHAKENGRNNFKFYTSELNQRVERRIMLEQEIRNAISKNEFTLFYQPLLSLKDNQVVGAEALIRWPHPMLGNIAPDDFIPIAEETGLILQLSDWIIKTACQQILTWHNQLNSEVYVSINLTARDFQQPNLVGKVRNFIDMIGIVPHCLELELTERMLVNYTEEAINIMNDLKAMGVRLSIDDFGVGYSSLSYLKRFPVDKLKIDRSFISDVTAGNEGSKDAEIVRAIIDLAHSMNMKVVAEGVETQFQQDFLRSLNCDYMQGYFFAKPMSEEDCTKRILSHNEVKEL